MALYPKVWLILPLLGLLVGCAGSSGDGAGSDIIGRSIGGPNDDQALGFAALSLDAVGIFAVTRPDGSFAVPNIPAGTYTVRVTKYGVNIFTAPVVVDPSGGNTIDLRRNTQMEGPVLTVLWPALASGTESIAGVVRDPEGLEIDGAEVLLIYPDGSFASVRTDIDGSFQQAGLPANPSRLVIAREDLSPLIVEDPFEALPRDNGVVQALVDLQPIPGLTPETGAMPSVEVRDRAGNLLSDLPVYLSRINPSLDPVDRLGRGRILGLNGTADFGQVPPGNYQVWAGSGDYFPTAQNITLAAGETPTVVLTLISTNGTDHPAFGLPPQ